MMLKPAKNFALILYQHPVLTIAVLLIFAIRAIFLAIADKSWRQNEVFGTALKICQEQGIK